MASVPDLIVSVAFSLYSGWQLTPTLAELSNLIATLSNLIATLSKLIAYVVLECEGVAWQDVEILFWWRRQGISNKLWVS